MIARRAPLELTALAKSFPSPDGPITAVQNVTFEVAEGEFVCIVGHSGCGKSTLLSILGLLDSPSDGVYLLNNKPVQGLDFAESGYLVPAARTGERR